MGASVSNTSTAARLRSARRFQRSYNDVGGRHGVGRIDITENRLVGMKSRGVYETPGGTIIMEGLRSLRSITIERDTLRACERMMPDYTDGRESPFSRQDVRPPDTRFP